MSYELNNNELIMLDALVYYKKLSDNYIPKKEDDDKIKYQTIEKFIDDAINEDYETCFDKLLSDEINGMVDILKLVKQNPHLTRLEIVYPDGFKNEDEQNTDQDNDYKWIKEDTASVCLVDPVTKNVYVIFGGNYADSAKAEFSTWVENFTGAVSFDTGEQENALRFYKESIAAARAYLNDEKGDLNITVSGHSAAGNIIFLRRNICEKTNRIADRSNSRSSLHNILRQPKRKRSSPKQT